MSRKITVAVIVTKQEAGWRYYSAMDKDGNTLMRLRVYDCGHGAHVAREEFKKHYNLSSADWASNLQRKFGI